jgi:hypothetical protein
MALSGKVNVQNRHLESPVMKMTGDRQQLLGE